jgi:hypothetical protein
MSEINCALFKVGALDWIRLREVRKNEKGSITATAAERCTIGNLRRYEDVIIRVARGINRGIIGFEEIEVWRKLKIHGIPLTRYVGRGTNRLEKLRDEIEAENAGVSVPMAARWLVTLHKSRSDGQRASFKHHQYSSQSGDKIQQGNY